MKLIWKLLKQNISKIQLFGFLAANLIGMIIVLLAFQFYFDINPIFTKKDDLFKQDYLTLTKKVGLFNSLSSQSSGFSVKEIDELKNSDFVKDLGTFTSSQYNVYAGFNQPASGIGFNTEMFFESVPNQFIDVKTNDWRFSPVDNNVPIILPKNYLDLYNFGFAESRSIPKISESMMSMINLDITIFGNGQRNQMKGRIVGFSNRINTILVPKSFMLWANQNFGKGSETSPARLIIKVNNIADPNITTFLKEKGYEVEGENTTASRMAFFLKTIISIVITIGIIICSLSFFILVLSIHLLFEKNMKKLQTLRLIGYSKLTITKPYERLVLILNSSILLLSLATTFFVKVKYSEIVKGIWTSFEPTSMVNTIFIGLAIYISLTITNIIIIRKKVS